MGQSLGVLHAHSCLQPLGILSGNGLWIDWRENWALNRAIEKIMMRFEGQHSVFDIAEEVGLDYWMVRDYVEKFRAKGFVTPLPIPAEAQDK